MFVNYRGGVRALDASCIRSPVRCCSHLLAFSNMTQVLYSRVPDSLKDDLDAFAGERGLTLTSAVVDLLQRGLEAAANERSIANLETQLAQTRAAQASAEANLTVAANELARMSGFVVRVTNTRVGSCPNAACRKEISGYDLLGTGQCPHCQASLLNLLAPRGNNIDQREFGLVVGALGAALVGLAYLGSKGK